MAFERIGGWIAVVALVFGLIAAAEGVAHYVLRVNSLAATVVDIQTPETLCLKLDLLDHFKGRKVVLLGEFTGIRSGDARPRQCRLAR